MLRRVFLSLLGCHICEVYELGLSKNNFIVQKSQNTRTNFEIQFSFYQK